MPLHQCPVCGVMHEVSTVRAQFAYGGRQLSCSGDCESERRRRRARYRHSAGVARRDEPSQAEVSRVPAELATS